MTYHPAYRHIKQRSNKMTKNKKLLSWVKEIEALCKPEQVKWCDGSQEEYDALMQQMVDSGAAIKLNEKKRPNSFLFRSHPSDVARVEDRTFIAAATKEEAGANNNWRDPAELRATLTGLFDGCMQGRTICHSLCVGPGQPFSIVGVEITDSPYVVANAHHDPHGRSAQIC